MQSYPPASSRPYPNTIQYSNYSKTQTTRLGLCSRETSSCVAKEKLFQVMEKGNKHGIPSSMDDEAKGGIRAAETMLRLVPMALCVSALVIMLRDSQANEYGSISYSDLGAFRYLVHANGICAGYSLLSAVIAAVPGRPTMSRAWTFFFLDQVLTYAILAAGAASIEVLFLAYNGDRAITWSAACSSFGGFCHKATASVVITLLVVACYAFLSLISSYRLFSRFDAPVTCTTKGIEIPNLQS